MTFVDTALHTSSLRNSKFRVAEVDVGISRTVAGKLVPGEEVEASVRKSGSKHIMAFGLVSMTTMVSGAARMEPTTGVVQSNGRMAEHWKDD